MNIFQIGISLTLVVYCSASYSCPGIWETGLQKSCYKILYGNMTWEEASVACRQIGGHLAIVTSQEETDFLKDYAYRHRPKSYLWRLWLNGKDDISENHWYWDWTGKPIKGYTYWNPGEPSNDGYPISEDCLGIYSNGRWNDFRCTEKCHAICEKEEFDVNTR